MWSAVYDKKTGALFSVGEVVAKELPDDLAVADLRDYDPENLDMRWDPETRQFLPAAPSPVFDVEAKITEILGKTALSREQEDTLRAEMRKLWGAGDAAGR